MILGHGAGDCSLGSVIGIPYAVLMKAKESYRCVINIIHTQCSYYGWKYDNWEGHLGQGLSLDERKSLIFNSILDMDPTCFFPTGKVATNINQLVWTFPWKFPQGLPLLHGRKFCEEKYKWIDDAELTITQDGLLS